MELPHETDDVVHPIDLGVGEYAEVAKADNDFSSNRLGKSLHIAKRAVQSTVIALEVLPTNEAIRFGAFGATMAVTRDPAIGALVLGGTTLAVEGSAALVSADLVASQSLSDKIGKTNKHIEKLMPSTKDSKMSLTTQAAVSYVGGSVVLMLARQREEPTISISESKRIGIKSAAALGAVFAAEGALVARGIGELDDWEKVGPAAVAVTGLFAAGRWAKKKVHNKE